MKIGTEHSFDIGNGTQVTLETGKLAKQADGSVVVKQGATMLLATVVSTKEAREGADFLPLTVEYREKFPSTGRFPGGFIKREARPSDGEILVSRLIDRALRPLFPDNYYCDTQVFVSLISSDKETMPDALACLAASAAIAVSDIPITELVSEVRIARIGEELKVNPSKTELEEADLDMIVAGTLDNIMMVEGEMQEASEQDMLAAIKLAHEAIKVHCQAQLDLAKSVGATEKREHIQPEMDEELYEKAKASTYQKYYDAAKSGIANKSQRKEAFSAIKDDFKEGFSEEELEEKEGLINTYCYKIQKDAIRRVMLDEETRLDGRQLNEIRPIWTEVNYLPGTHGSAIFTRGETQALATITLGSRMDEQSIDSAFHKDSLKFMLHYNFPPFSTGETKRIMSVSRREIGHGNLAMRALKPMIPVGQENPYTIRIVSDVLESNGSSSMATVCAGSLALMDAGIKIPKPVSGIAMGLITDGEKFAVLSDILGDEDHLGDMDFKVTGTVDGITACQMDIKVDGLPYEVLEKALLQAKEGRLHILGEMAKTISQPNDDYKPHAPRIDQLVIPKDLIGAVIGPGGKIIQEIQAETGTTIVIEEKDGQGYIDIVSDNIEARDGAIARIKAITAMPEVGETYTGKVKNITSFGAFVEILPGKDGLLHISEIEWRRLENVESVLKEGDEVTVKLLDIDPKSGKLKLSRKALLPKPDPRPAE